MNVLSHGELIADADTGVESVDCGNKCWEGGGGVLPGASDKKGVVTWILANGKIDAGAKGLVEPTFADIVDSSNDLMERTGRENLISDGLSNWVLAVKELLCHSPVDDDNGGMGGVVSFGKETPAEKPGLEGGKVVGAYGTGHG